MVRHFLYISDFSATELLEILQLAGELKTKFRARDDHRPFAGRSLAMIFAKPSARTRVSFETGFSWMGGHALFLGPGRSLASSSGTRTVRLTGSGSTIT